ncbi:MAG: hypothetical protein RRC34_08090 [Lentisphaeria bacterium]|nr:hypothetical protein [Lentisphaeria bacterium]
MDIDRRLKAFLFGTMAVVVACTCACLAQEDEEADPDMDEAAADSQQVKLDVELGAPFCDNAVLQRGMGVPVWGWSKPGDTVTVSFANQTKTGKAGEDGMWMVRLDAMKASLEPREMVVTEQGGKSVTIKNILVGEVWMASGQSNMQYKVGGKGVNTIRLATQFMEQVKAPVIREFEVTSVTAQLHPIEKATGAWKNGDYSNYSAIAFAFAHKLYTELNVPVGILNCSWSQTAIQAWVPREGWATAEDDYSKAINLKCLQTDPSTPEHQAAWSAFYTSLENQIAASQAALKNGGKAISIGEKAPGNMSGNRDANWLFNGRLNPVVPYAIRGAIWNQGYANMGEGLPYYNNLHNLVRGWRIVWDRPDLPVYFHQFYCPGRPDKPSIDGTAEMRLATWMARDIPNAGMASQIDISGGIHYSNKTVPGQRLALLALKNQYPSTTLRTGGKAKDLVAEGPMFKSYKVDGDKIIVEFDHADGGLVVADTAFNRSREEGATGFADPKVIENGEPRVKLFWLAGEDRVWHPATFRIDGDKVVVTSADVKEPRGISYGSGGIGFQPCLYNQALLPMTPFIQYDNRMVTSEWWLDPKLQIVGETIDPNTVGKLNEYRKMPLLSVQFRDNAIFQADKPVTVWGSTRNFGEWQAEDEEGDCKVHFEFGPSAGSGQADIKKVIPVEKGMVEWSVTLPPMKAGPKPHTLKVSFTIDGELAHERVVDGIVFGDVYYVAAPPGELKLPETDVSGQIVRSIENHSKRGGNSSPSRYSVCVSRTPDNRFASRWVDEVPVSAKKGAPQPAKLSAAGIVGHTIAARTGRPVGIIFMQSKMTGQGKGKPSLDLNTISHWMAPAFLKDAPSLMEDYRTVGSQYPDNPYYLDNVRRYINDWKSYWGDYIPEMMKTRAIPEGAAWGANWGHYPSPDPKTGDSKATQVYNIYVHPFSPAALSGVVFLTSASMVTDAQGANFGPEMSALGASFRKQLGLSDDVPFIYTVPARDLAPRITLPDNVPGKSVAVEISEWTNGGKVLEALLGIVAR